MAFGLTFKSQQKLSELFADIKGGTVEEWEEVWREINDREARRIAKNEVGGEVAC